MGNILIRDLVTLGDHSTVKKSDYLVLDQNEEQGKTYKITQEEYELYLNNKNGLSHDLTMLIEPTYINAVSMYKQQNPSYVRNGFYHGETFTLNEVYRNNNFNEKISIDGSKQYNLFRHIRQNTLEWSSRQPFYAKCFENSGNTIKYYAPNDSFVLMPESPEGTVFYSFININMIGYINLHSEEHIPNWRTEIVESLRDYFDHDTNKVVKMGRNPIISCFDLGSGDISPPIFDKSTAIQTNAGLVDRYRGFMYRYFYVKC